MRLTYRQIEYLREVSRQKSISDACSVMKISQSSIIAAIDTAEAITGTRLFERRKGKGINLTPAGQRFLVSAQRFLASGEDFNRSLNAFSKSTTPVLRIGCFSPFGALLIPQVFQRFLQQYGECELILLEGDQAQLQSWIATGEVDVVVTYEIGEEFGNKITPICKIPTHGVVNKNDVLAEQKSVSLEELATRQLILLDLPETRTYLVGLFDLAPRRPKIGLRTRSYETVRTAVSSGLGMTVLNIKPSYHASQDSENIVRIPLKDKLKQPTLLAADPYGDRKPGYVISFIRVLHDYIADLGPERFAVVLPEYSKDLIYPKPDF